jgi:hypothetical protein
MLKGYWAAKWQKAFADTYKTPDEDTKANKTKGLTNMRRWQTQLIQTT